MNSLLNINSGADYQTQLGVKGRLRRSVNVPRMEATICRVKGGYGKIWPTKGWTDARLLYTIENTQYIMGNGRSE